VEMCGSWPPAGLGVWMTLRMRSLGVSRVGATLAIPEEAKRGGLVKRLLR